MADDIKEYWRKKLYMPKRDVLLNWRATKEEKQQLEQEAKESGTNISEETRERVFGSELPQWLREALKATADAMHLPLNTVRNHQLIRRAAFDDAYKETFGRNKQVLKEFFFAERNDGGKYLVTGEELFDILKEDYLRLFAEFKDTIKELLELAEKSDIDVSRFTEKFGEFIEAH